TLVGLDVHVSGTVAAVLDRDSGEVRRRRLSGRGEEIAAFVTGLRGPVRATYEAGPTGFALARRLESAGVDCLVCAPGLMASGPAASARSRTTSAASRRCWCAEASSRPTSPSCCPALRGRRPPTD